MQTLVDVVEERAATHGGDVFLRHLVTGEVSGSIEELTYAALARHAKAIAATLQEVAAVGDRALLLYPSGFHFVSAFVGCLFAGVIPVPAYPPDLAKPERGIAKLRAIAADCGARIVLTSSDVVPMFAQLAPAYPEFAALRVIASDACTGEHAWRAPEITGETIALLQYTSGSTGAPKGVIVRHRQLLANERSIAAKMGPVRCVVGWLPVFHDMGLIGNVLQVLCAGANLVMMSPIAFLKRPARWLEAITHFRADTSGGPNFAYDVCVRRISDEDRARIDLGSWELAFCGAEPVRAATLDRFCDVFEPRGFRRAALYPCYGLAEATLFVSGGTRGVAPQVTTHDGRTLVSCGQPGPTEEIRIDDGEICVRGPALASGYWGRESAAFGADGFLRTGDVGFVRDGELYVTGRIKEMIILAGRNLFPQDIEATVEAAVPAVRKGCCCAFSIERDGDEKLVIVAEAEGDVDVSAIKRAVFEEHGAAVFDVVLAGKGTLPKTSSGKLERYACRDAYVRG